MRVSAQGPDEAAALQALKGAVESGLGEEEEAPAAEALAAYEWEAEPDQMVVPGSPASPGLAIGPLRFVKRSAFVVETTARDVEAEKTRLKEAIAAARVQLHDLYGEVKARSGAGQASIFLAQAEFLDDPGAGGGRRGVDRDRRGRRLCLAAGHRRARCRAEHVDSLHCGH